MATRTRKQKLPVVYPSVPDIESKPGVHDEPAPPARPDRMPPGRLRISPQRSRAALRLRIEQLLLRRDSIPEKEWAELGDEGRELLVELVDDPAIRSHDALRHRAIAVLGHLGVRSAIVPLNAILSSRTEAPVTRAYAATALGHIGGQAAVPGLATSLGDEDDMVRRQVAKALGRIDHVDAIPHLLKLRADPSIAVAEVAVAAIQGWEKSLGERLGKATRVPARTAVRKKKKKKTSPATDE